MGFGCMNDMVRPTKIILSDRSQTQATAPFIWDVWKKNTSVQTGQKLGVACGGGEG